MEFDSKFRAGARAAGPSGTLTPLRFGRHVKGKEAAETSPAGPAARAHLHRTGRHDPMRDLAALDVVRIMILRREE
jgi:hypothetical protein